MSTYTTIHNRVRENITIDTKRRITAQQVKMLNEQNEFWGTFRGKIESTGYEISGGTIVDAVLSNVMVRGSIDIPGIGDLSASVRHLSSDVVGFDSRLTALDSRLRQEVEQRASDDDYLSSAIDSQLTSIDTQLSGLSSLLTEQDRMISVEVLRLAALSSEDAMSSAANARDYAEEISSAADALFLRKDVAKIDGSLQIGGSLSVCGDSIVLSDSKVIAKDGLEIDATGKTVSLSASLVDVTAPNGTQDIKINGRTLKEEIEQLSVTQFEYDKTTDPDDPALVLVAGSTTYRVPMSQFGSSETISAVIYDQSSKNIIISFNPVDATTRTPISVDLADLYNRYDAAIDGGLELSAGNLFKVDFTKVASVESVNAVKSVLEKTAKATGHLSLNAGESGSKTVAQIFEDNGLLNDGKILNGSFVDVILDDADKRYETADGLTVGNEDFVLIFSAASTEYVLSSDFRPKSDGTNEKTVYAIGAMHAYDIQALEDLIQQKTVELSSQLSSKVIEKDGAIEELSAGSAPYNTGDIFVAKSAIADGKQKRSSYAYDAQTSAFVSLVENLNADDVVIDQDMRFTRSFGKYEISACGYVDVDMRGETLKSLLLKAFQKKESPVVSLPSIDLTVESAVSAEVGSDFTWPSAVLKFSDAGSYQFDDSTGVIIGAGNACITQGTLSTYSSEVMVEGDELTAGGGSGTLSDGNESASVIATVNYNAGIVPHNNMGEDDDAAKISAGTLVKTASSNAFGLRRCFYGYRLKSDDVATMSDGTETTSALDISKLTSDNIRSSIHAKTAWCMKDNIDGKFYEVDVPFRSFAVPVGTKQIIIAMPHDIAPARTEINATSQMLGKIDFSNANRKETGKANVSGANGAEPIPYDIWHLELDGSLASETDITIEWKD